MMVIRRLLGITEPYEVLFFDREYRSLAGVGKRLIISLVGILTLTLAAICFAVGAIENLSIKMNDPFTNWLEVPLRPMTGITSDNVGTFMTEYDTLSVKNKYAIGGITKVGLVSISFYKRTFDPFSHRVDTLVRTQNGQTIDFDGKLFSSIVSKENVIQDFTEGDTLKPELQQIIINSELLRILGYKKPVLDGSKLLVQTRHDEFLLLEIAGVVKKLPRNISFVCSESFMKVFGGKGSEKCQGYLKGNKRGGIHFSALLQGDDSLRSSVCRDIENYLELEDEVILDLKDSAETINSIEYQPAILKLGYGDEIGYSDLLEFLGNNAIKVKPFILAAEFADNIDCPGKIEDRDVKILQFDFLKLNHIESFAREIQDEYGVKINMRETESKKNFSLVSDLTMTIGIILFSFGLLSIILYVNNQLRTHLSNIKSNLGTFKAFGLSNKFLVGLYRKIVLTYLIVGVSFALVFVFGIDLIEYLVVDENESKFNSLSPWLFLAIVCLFVISDLVSRRTIRRILGKTPGDLIYNR